MQIFSLLDYQNLINIHKRTELVVRQARRIQKCHLMAEKAIKLKATGRTLAAKCTFSPWGPPKLPWLLSLSCYMHLGVRVITYSKMA
jgi:hypothetical protein